MVKRQLSLKRLLLLAVIASGLTGWTFWALDGFFPHKIQGPLQEGEATPPSDEVLALLRQPYRYLAKGRQCFVFVSQDGEYVIKFLNYNRFTLPFPFKQLPFLKGLLAKRQRRFAATMQSYEIADSHLKEETGIVLAHLKEGGHLGSLEIEDRGRGRHCIDLDKTAFVLQKRATPIYEALEEQFRAFGKEGLEAALTGVVGFLQKRCDLGIADDDRDLEINFGFCGQTPILLDPGRVFFDPSLQTQEGRERECKAATKKLRRYLVQNHPEEVEFLERVGS